MSNVPEKDQEGKTGFEKFAVVDPGPHQLVNAAGEARVDYEKFRIDPASPVLASTPVPNQYDITKPKAHWILQTHMDPLWTFIAFVLKVGIGDFYVVDPALRFDLVGIVHRMILIPCITTLGRIFLWPIRLPNARGHLDAWNKEALAAAGRRGTWFRIAANEELECYTVDVITTHLAEPQWPADLTFEKILDSALSSRLIETPDHPAIIAAFTEDKSSMR